MQTTYIVRAFLQPITLDETCFYAKMDHHSRLERDSEDSYSHLPRSRASSTNSTTSGFRNLNLIDSAHRPQPPSYINRLSHRSSTYLQEPTSYPSQKALETEWNEGQSQSQGTPLLRVEPARDNTSSSLAPPATSTMR